MQRKEEENSLAPTNKSQSVIEPPTTLIKALMRHRKPLYLLRKHFITIFTQHPDVELIESFRVSIDQKLRSFGIEPQTKRALRERRGV